MADEDIELRAIGAVVAALVALPDDESRRRVVSYAQVRCIRPLPVFNISNAQAQWQNNPGIPVKGVG